MSDSTTSLQQATLTGPIEAQLVTRTMNRGAWEPTHLETVRDKYQALKATLSPHNLERPGQHFRFLVPNGHPPSLQLITEHAASDPYALTKTALSQLANAVFTGGKKFYDGLLALASMRDPDGAAGMHRRLAEAVANRFLIQDQTPRLVRAFGNLPGSGPVVRAFLSQSYSVVDDLDLVQALLENRETRELPVLEAKSTDAGTRIRLALDPSVSHTKAPDPGRPIPLLEVWNSEVGRRGVWAVLGIWKLICLNGLTGFDERMRYMWRHKGNKERILSGVGEFICASKTKVSGVLDAYKEASDVQIQHMLAFVQGLGQGSMPVDTRLSKVQVDRVTSALLDPTVTKTPAGDLSLVSVIDAMTLAAQSERDVFEVERLEHAAGYVLRRGLAAGEKSAGIIEVRLDEDRALVSW